MDLTPREMRELLSAVRLDVDGIPSYSLAATPAREFLETVSPLLGGPHVLRQTPRSARSYILDLLGLDSSAPWETVLLCAARVGCTAPGMIKIHDDSDLAHPWDTDDIERYGYGCYTHPGCTPDNMLLTDGGLCSGDLSGVFCHVCGSDRGHTRCLWIHPQHLDTAINPSPNRDCSEE